MCRLFVVLAAAISAWPQQPAAGDRWTALREEMVRTQIAGRGVRNPDVLRAMRAVPRHLFIPERQRAQAYEDHPVPVGYGQTISQPYIVGFMTELLEVRRTDRILEIGTGSGYQAAILALLAKQVYSIEIVPELAKSASATLRRLGYGNVSARRGDGYQGWREEAPFDRILLTAAPPEVPKTLIEQLKPGGRLVAPEGTTPWDQELVVIDKARDGKLTRRAVLPVRFVPMVRD